MESWADVLAYQSVAGGPLSRCQANVRFRMRMKKLAILIAATEGLTVECEKGAGQDCAGCALKPRCTTAARRFLTRHFHEGALQRMNARVKADPSLMRQRRCAAEHPFGTIKRMTAGGRFEDRETSFENTKAAMETGTIVPVAKSANSTAQPAFGGSSSTMISHGFRPGGTARSLDVFVGPSSTPRQERAAGRPRAAADQQPDHQPPEPDADAAQSG